MKWKKVDLAVVGVTDMVGRTFMKVLEEKNRPVDSFYMFTSACSAGQWGVANSIRKGAASNAIQISEVIIDSMQ